MSRAVHWLRTGWGSFRRVASLPVSDRGFRYGMAVFETIGVRRGEARFLEEHLQSGLEACKASAFHVDELWFRQAGEFVRATLLPGDTGIVRIHVTAGDGSPTDPADHCRMLLTYEAREPIEPSVYERGYHVSIWPVPFSPTFEGRKTHNYWPNIAILQAARLDGADECLVFNPQGHLASASMANVFFVFQDGRIITPPLSSGCRRGVIRQWVMLHGNVREAIIERSDLRHADEVFLTSSWLGIMPVTKADDIHYAKKSVSTTLMTKYHC